MECPFCKTNVKYWNEPCRAHLIVTKNAKDNHFHMHGELNNKELMRELIDAATLEADIVKQDQKLDRKELVFHNRQRIGDILMFTCAIRDFKNAYPDIRVNVISTASHIWDNNPYIDSTLIPTPENTIKIGPSRLTNASNRLDWHFSNAYRVSIEDALNIHIQQGESRPDIWLTEEEYSSPRVTEKSYWIIVVGGERGWGCKMYPFERWQEFVNQNQDILFYQLGAKEDNQPKLQGENVIDYIGKTQDHNTGIRDLFKLFLNAEGSIGLVSFQMHLSGAFNKPCIVVAGAREPVSFTRYPGQQYLATDGCLPCAVTACWHCNIDACSNLITGKEKVPKCIDMITPADLTIALNRYYTGGRLKKNVVSAKPKFKNIVKIQKIFISVSKEELKETKYGIQFGGGSLTFRDWEFIRDTIKENRVQTILEFGAGLSTLLLNELGLKVITYETFSGWIDKIRALNNKCDVRLWDGKSIDNVEKVDFAFVDGPAGGVNREFSTRIASEAADILVIHDASRKDEMIWQEKYLKGNFFGPGGGGQRCHLWSKNRDTKIAFRTGSPLYIDNTQTEVAKQSPKENVLDQSKFSETDEAFGVATKDRTSQIFPYSTKFIKFVSTARGWGGCARSVTSIMKFLLADSHKVEFIPFRNSVGSSEFRTYIKDHLKDLIVTENYNTLNEACDILFIYVDDFCWEFGTSSIIEAFSGVNAEKKIMMLNYRRGKIGEIEWTKNWDKYMFLNSTQEKELLKVLPNAKTKVLPPCTELEEFFKVQPNYNDNIRIVRHSSQGDAKFSKNFKEEIDAILNSRNDVEIKMMPGPSFINSNDKFKKYTRNEISIPEFLQLGNLFVYSLPEKYYDQGPRVVLEAMASSLAVVADNWGGCTDRINTETGWLCNTKEQMIETIRNITFEELQKKGKAAREFAYQNFKPEVWISEIVE